MTDLFSQTAALKLPRQYALDGKVGVNTVRQVGAAARVATGTLTHFAAKPAAGFSLDEDLALRTLILPRKPKSETGAMPVLLVPDASTIESVQARLEDGDAKWLSPAACEPASLSCPEALAYCGEVRASWQNQFTFAAATTATDGTQTPGLRLPQIGALHATLAHWSVGDQPATIVMPTGTGKTETMLALLVATGIERLLVVVPPNTELRDQTVRKFLSLGVLQEAGCLPAAIKLPVVAILEHKPKDTSEVDELFQRANVIVTTMNIAGQSPPEVQERMAEHVTHLFIDEAHHLAARTWTDFKAHFVGNTRIVQFTATPFRTDGKRIDGKFIYVYPLAKAQREGYFTPIRFGGVQGLDQDDADAEIIKRVGIALDTDLAAGFDHLVMARVDNIERAKKVHALYAARLPAHTPVLVHSKLSARDRREALAKLSSRQSRIIVCVDMLGEGFDLPELKIAALHDRHKSIAITLQFTGRFTRTKSRLGNATVIANTSQEDVEDALRSLYAEDADWNFLLQTLSESRTQRQVKRAEILAGFADKLEEVPLQVLEPRMSTVVFRTACENWAPFKVDEAIPPAQIYAGPTVNEAARLAIFITRDDEYVRWGDVKQLINTEWNLYLVHWDEERQLLFVNSSKGKDLHDHVAKAVCGDSVTRVSGETVFRALHGFNRLVLTNLGLSHPLGRYVRYTMFMGVDITEQLSGAATQGRRKSNLFGQGFTHGGKATIGCSAKGKIWSHQVAYDFSEWVDWCQEIGTKLLDDSITTDRIIKNLVKPRLLTERPDQPPLAIHWPESFLQQFEERIEITFGDRTFGFHDCDIEIASFEATGPLLFRVVAEGYSAVFEITIRENAAEYTLREGANLVARIGSKTKPLVEWFADDPPHLHFANGDFLVFNELFELPRDDERQAFDVAKIEARDWTGTDLRKESQGLTRDRTSIQYRVIADLLANPEQYDVVVDDDGTGEIADIVAFKLMDTVLRVDLYHCKYSSEDKPGSRVADLFEVCGQAQKCVRWREYPHRLFKHIQKREGDRRRDGQSSRMQKGSGATINTFAGRWRELRFEYRVFIVQPGLSAASVSGPQLDLLAATEAYLLDTYAMPLRVIAST